MLPPELERIMMRCKGKNIDFNAPRGLLLWSCSQQPRSNAQILACTRLLQMARDALAPGEEPVSVPVLTQGQKVRWNSRGSNACTAFAPLGEKGSAIGGDGCFAGCGGCCGCGVRT